jgi:hypothetical protein
MMQSTGARMQKVKPTSAATYSWQKSRQLYPKTDPLCWLMFAAT